MEVGDQVVAQNRITEVGLLEAGEVHVHAEPGEVGIVVTSTVDLRGVTWSRTGTTSECHVSELGTSAPLEPQPELCERLN